MARPPVSLAHRPSSMHPCLSCGACCAHFRVTLHWSETSAELGFGTPPELTEPFGPHQQVMRGTWQRQPRCVGLQGIVGEEAHCGIYSRRPSACRELFAAWENGKPSAQCDRARQAYGLMPLQPEDWLHSSP
ncbi:MULTISPECIES: YkgJ family cysteine cluster protein [unclassified Pseudoxanthomonas]|uniref:YkgJ family cysteine cluster protein n=1 Tax=unclassified Pseudoxanthomonas TaxID=2645906 RepID=UPI003078845F